MKLLLIIFFTSLIVLLLVFFLNAATYNGSQNLAKKQIVNDHSESSDFKSDEANK